MTLEERDELMREEGREEEREKRIEAEKAAARAEEHMTMILKRIMSLEKLSAAEALEMLDIPEAERLRYLEKLS